jgi:hypothetical protein
MKRHFSLSIFICLVLLSPTAALADGDIYAGGPYGTKITSLPYTISAPGAYYLGSNLSYSGPGNGITINSDDVTLDLMGFALTYSGSGTDNFGIYLDQGNNVEIRNGTIHGWEYGIHGYDTPPHTMGHRIINVRFEGNTNAVWVAGYGHLIEGCQATAGSRGPGWAFEAHGAMVIDCSVEEIYWGIGANFGIFSGNVVNNCGWGIGTSIDAGLIRGNEISNTTVGISLIGGGSASIIGNTIKTSSDQVGIWDDNYYGANLFLLDQNTITGPGVHYNIPSGPQMRNNAGYP